MWDDRVDSAIDDVARQMTEGLPADAAAFRRQVLLRIDAGSAPRRSWRAAFVLPPVAAAAALVIAAFVMRGGRTQPQVTSPPTLSRRSEQARPLRGPMATTAPAAAAIAAARPAADRPGRNSTPVDRAEDAAEPPAPLDPITVAPLVIDTLRPDPLPLERLETIVPLTVAPFDIIEMQRRFE